MKKMFFASLIIAIVSSLCFAMEIPHNKPAPVALKTKTFTGKVVSVSIGDPAKGIRSEIVIEDERGQKLSFIINPTFTKIIKKGNVPELCKLSEINKGSKVTVGYTTDKDGINQTIFLEVVE